MQIRIYYEDTDCGGIVYHANYLKFCERARSEWFFSSGLLPNDEKFGFVVKNMQLEFLQSSKLGDVLEMHAKILQLKHASIVLEQWITLKEKKIFFATLVLVCVQKDGKISKIPQWARKILLQKANDA